MFAVFAITLPIYLIVFVGFLVVKSGYLSAADFRATGTVVLRVSMPALIFLAIIRNDIGETLHVNFLAGYAAGSLFVFGVGMLIARRLLRQDVPSASLEALGMSCSNSAFMGFPVAALVVGDTALQAFAMAMLVENIIMMPLAVTIAESARDSGSSGALRRTLGGMVRNPLLIAVVAGFAFSLSGLTLPAALFTTLEMLAPIAPPVALLAIGGTVAALALRAPEGPMIWVVAGKLILHPLAVWAALLLAGPMSQDMLLAGVLIASVPMMSIYALFGYRYGQETMAASALILATILSFATVSALVALIGRV